MKPCDIRSGGPIAIALSLVLIFAWKGLFAHPDEGSPIASETSFRNVLENDPANIEARNRLGLVLLEKRKYNEAEKEFTEVLRRTPGDFDALDGMGLVMLGRGNYDEAGAWFEKALTIRREDTLVHVHRGRALEKAGKYKEAEEAYLDALAVNERLMAASPAEREKRKTVRTALSRIREKLRTPEAEQ